jgi:hypothetical protein
LLGRWERDLNSIELACILTSLEEQGLLFQDDGQVVSLVLANSMLQSVRAADESVTSGTAEPPSEGKNLLISQGVVKSSL